MKVYSGASDSHLPEIDPGEVRRFFDLRSNKIDTVGYKSAVMYQDKEPALAEARDDEEKRRLLPKLMLSETDRFLDIGCGTGRWAEAVSSEVRHYHGVDFSPGLLAEARARNPANNVSFSCASCTDLVSVGSDVNMTFNRIICFGVLMYLNDEDIPSVMRGIADLSGRGSIFLLREPVGLEQRLTIKQHYSEDMEQYYNAIYRTESELVAACLDGLKTAGFRLDEVADLFDDPYYNNRADTRQKFFVFKRD